MEIPQKHGPHITDINGKTWFPLMAKWTSGTRQDIIWNRYEIHPATNMVKLTATGILEILISSIHCHDNRLKWRNLYLSSQCVGLNTSQRMRNKHIQYGFAYTTRNQLRTTRCAINLEKRFLMLMPLYNDAWQDEATEFGPDLWTVTTVQATRKKNRAKNLAKWLPTAYRVNGTEDNQLTVDELVTV